MNFTHYLAPHTITNWDDDLLSSHSTNLHLPSTQHHQQKIIHYSPNLSPHKSDSSPYPLSSILSSHHCADHIQKPGTYVRLRTQFSGVGSSDSTIGLYYNSSHLTHRYSLLENLLPFVRFLCIIFPCTSPPVSDTHSYDTSNSLSSVLYLSAHYIYADSICTQVTIAFYGCYRYFFAVLSMWRVIVHRKTAYGTNQHENDYDIG